MMNLRAKKLDWIYVGLFVSVAAFFVLIFPAHKAQAVPSFARQTGLACSSCHTNPPELTPLGRTFKLNGYSMRGINVISAPPTKQAAGLSLLSYLPLSAWLEISTTGLNKPQPDTQNWSYSLPQDASLFLAGAYASHLGGFIQVTYDVQSDHFSFDNTDIRYARNTLVKGKTLVYGVDFNNNPTVEDLWNTTPAWGFPFIASPSAPSPAAVAIVDGTLGSDVAGFGGYAMWNDHLYGAAAIYRSSHLGQSLPNPGVNFDFNIQGAAPYWRVAWQQTMGNSYLEFGGYGMHMRSTPQAIVGPEDIYTDAAVDAQFERVIPKWRNNLITLHGTYIHENSTLNAEFPAAASVLNHHLNTFRADAVYHFGYRFAPSFQYFATTGTTDPLLFAPNPFDGSGNGSPNSKGYVINFTNWPVQNIRLGAQYTGFTQFNGAGTNYDGSGRNASDNNSLYMLVGLVF